MMIVLHAEPVLTNVLLRQFQRAISIKLIRMYALIAVPVQTYAPLKQFILNSYTTDMKPIPQQFCGIFFHVYLGLYLAPSRTDWTSDIVIISARLKFLLFLMNDSTILNPTHTAARPGDSFVK